MHMAMAMGIAGGGLDVHMLSMQMAMGPAGDSFKYSRIEKASLAAAK